MNLLPFWIAWKVRLLMGAVVVLLLTGMYFYAYSDGKSDCQMAALEKVEEENRKEMIIAAREATVNKREAELALAEFTAKEQEHVIVYERVERNAKANPNTSCVLGDQLVRDLGEILGEQP